MTSSTYGRRANRYLGDGLETANPSTLLVMLYDRLLLDLQRAEKAQLEKDIETGHNNLVHAQEIVVELQSSLNTDVWDGGQGLLALYTWLLQEMSESNITGDAQRTAACREIVEPLADAWRQAALESASASPATGHGVA